MAENNSNGQKEKTAPPIVDEIGVNKIIGQIQSEYKIAYDFLRPKLNEWLVRLSLYNNQKRDADKVGDPLLFTTFQTLLASLYDDELAVEFLPREEGDIERAESLNSLAKFDYDEMQKNMVDLEWDWDTMFFGRGLLLLQEFDRGKMHPIPQVIDPATFLRDPKANSVNGDIKGYNSARFFGREISLTKEQLNSPVYFDVNELKTGEELQSLLAKASQERSSAQGLNPKKTEEITGDNAEFDLLEWYTHFGGKKYLVVLGNARSKIIRFTPLKEDTWPVIDRPLFPVAHDWDGVSVPDLVEDKQRARAVLQNLGLASAKADVYPMYLFDENKIRNRAHLNFGFNKFIPTAGPTDNAVVPLQKAAVHNTAGWIMDLLDQSAQRALATPEIQQGIISKQQRTLGELNLVSAKVDTRYSLAAKIFGFSEKIFWEKWYGLYKRHFKDGIDKKIIRLVGVWGPKFKKLAQKDLILNIDPDIKIESKIMAEAQRLRERNDFASYLGTIVNDPTINRRFAFKKLGKLNGVDHQELKMLFPPTLDEMKAEEENDLIEKKQAPKVEIREDHPIHIQIHGRLPETPVRENHIQAHEYAMYLKRKNAELFAQQQAMERPPLETAKPMAEEKPTAGRQMPVPNAMTPK
jgi:hypothetical protein